MRPLWASPGLWSIGWLVVLLACHDHARNNPMDAALTPAVSITAVNVDTLAGLIDLEWTPYSGGQPFAEYRVVRKAKGMDEVTLAVLADPAQVSYQDASARPDVDYLYRVLVANRSGLVSGSAWVSASSYQVRGVALVGAQPDTLAGTIVVRWRQYQGPAFARYQVWRRTYGHPDSLLALMNSRSDTVWTDADAVPETAYTYWVATEAAGLTLESPRQEASLRRLHVVLEAVDCDPHTATAQLRWRRYRGPQFAAYDVRRQVAGLPEESVAVLPAIDDTAFTDRRLNGNTVYQYRVWTRTRWPDSPAAASNSLSGQIYALVQQLDLPGGAHLVQAVQLALDASQRLVVATTSMAPTTAHNMVAGIGLWRAGDPAADVFFARDTPLARSPVRLAVFGDVLYVAVAVEGDSILVGAVRDRRALWSTRLAAGGEHPAGLYANGDSVLVVDTQGWLHWVLGGGSPGVRVVKSEALRSSIVADLPVTRAVMAPAAGKRGYPQVFLAAPYRPGNHLTARLRVSAVIWGGTSAEFAYDDGVGPGPGQTLTPLDVAYDAVGEYLLVLEGQGRIQVLDGRPADRREAGSRYITQWGRFGGGSGEFQPSPVTAASLVVDRDGRVYVADGAARVQVFVP
jgi:hypothetical protein